MSDRSWRHALDEHRDSLAQFTSAMETVPAIAWTQPTAPGKWSPAAVTLHVIRAYELGADAMSGGRGMRMRLRPLQAWALRVFLLPYFVASGRFPRGAEAPGEVVPDLEEAHRLSVSAATQHLADAAYAALEGFTTARRRRPQPKLRHAYFGELSPVAAFRLLSAHTRHHARGLAHAMQRDHGS